MIMPIKSLSCIITISILKLLFPPWLFVLKTLSCCISLPHKRPQPLSEDSDGSHPAMGGTSSFLRWTVNDFAFFHSALLSVLPFNSALLLPHWVCLCTPNSLTHSFECRGGIILTSSISLDECTALMQTPQFC